MEFSPYEIGMAKYGTFMKTELFGSKFFMGKLCKEFEEPPLHFLQGKMIFTFTKLLSYGKFEYIILDKDYLFSVGVGAWRYAS